MEVYVQSSKHIKDRFLIFRTINKENVVDEIIKLDNGDITEEVIDEINSFIRGVTESNVKLYVISKIMSDKRVIKDKWTNSKEAKEFNRLVENKNIEVYSFKGLSELTTELCKVITNYNRAKKKPTRTINNKEFRMFSDYTGELNQINLYLRGIADYTHKDRVGYAVAVLNKSVFNKELYFEDKNTTANRMLLLACVEAVKQLKEPCAINILSHTHLGIFRGNNTNRDLKDELILLLKEGNHCINEYVSRNNQEYLIGLIKHKFMDIKKT